MSDLDFWDIDNYDVANSNSSDELDEINELGGRVTTLFQIDDTIWFKDILLHPVNVPEMEYFLEQLDVLDSFKKFNVDDVYNMSPKRLDALFLISKMINLQVVTFCERLIQKYFIPQFESLIYDNLNMLSLDLIDNDQNNMFEDREKLPIINAFLEEFYTDLIDFVIRFLDSYQSDINNNPTSCDVITPKLIKYIRRTLNTKYYGKILIKLRLVFPKQFFKDNYQTFHEMTRNFIQDTIEKAQPFLVLINIFVNKFLDNLVSDDNLLEFINDKINIQRLIDLPSDAIDVFCLTMMYDLPPTKIAREEVTWISNYNNFIFNSDHKIESKKYAFWLKTDNNLNHMDMEKQTKINAITVGKIGMELYPEYELNNILTLFVKHNLVKDEGQLLDMIVNIMEKNRYDFRIFGKYDDTDLDMSYTLSALGNDIKMSYDEFLTNIKTKRTLTNYPIEFILRLISRILNVTIHFYDTYMSCITIDNNIYQYYTQPIIIYQTNYFNYYLLYPKGQQFEPIGNNSTKINVQTGKKKGKKIVEI